MDFSSLRELVRNKNLLRVVDRASISPEMLLLLPIISAYVLPLTVKLMLIAHVTVQCSNNSVNINLYTLIIYQPLVRQTLAPTLRDSCAILLECHTHNGY